MNKTRKSKIEQIIKSAKIEKNAQEAVDNADINSEDGEEFAHKIFQELLEKIKSEVS